MNYQHKELASGKWAQLPLMEAMANIGSEVERAMKWRRKGNEDYARRAADRALGLFDLTLDCTKGYSRLKEVGRAREVFADYFYGENEYKSTDASWSKYFMQFTYAARFPRSPA